MSHDANDPGHGHTVAAWTAVTIILIATTVGTVFFFFDMPLLVWGSAAVAAAGVLVGWILRQMGYGSKPKS
jgi:hydrogenase-4 membrane subunit HyfE